jgi:hypothetical protein
MATRIMASETSRRAHPAEGAFDHPSAGQNLKALLIVGASDDLDAEVEIGGLVHQLQPVVGRKRGVSPTLPAERGHRLCGVLSGKAVHMLQNICEGTVSVR